MEYVHSFIILTPASDSPIRFTRGILVDDSIVFAMPAAATATASVAPVAKPVKPQHVPDKKYKCQFCARAFSRSEHRSRHERSRKFIRTFPSLLVDGGVASPWWGREETHLLPTFTNFYPSRAQTPKNDLSNAQSAAVPLYDEIFCYDMIEPSTPKMEEYRWSAKSRGGRAQSQHPRPPPQSHPSTWIRQRWNK